MLILNRVVADCLFTASILWEVVMGKSSTELQGRGKLFYTLGVYAAVVTYLVLALLKLYMVARPLHARMIRLRHCVISLLIR